jgi:hypothetical protein
MQRGIRPRSSQLALGALAALTVLSAVGRAPAADGEPPVDTAPARQTATIVLIGDIGADTELGMLLRELLGRRNVEVTLQREAQFEPDALFAGEQGRSFSIFIARRGEHEARLYFRAPNGERYLVRRLTLPSGLDAVGREALSQVVESSTDALLDAAQGVTREQATREIEDDAPAVVPVPVITRLPPTHSPASELKRSDASWEPRLRARYAAFWQGSELGFRHGPGLGLGVLYRAGVLFGVELGGERFFEQSFSGPDLGGEVEASDVFLNIVLGLPLGGGQRLLLALGPRLEPSRVRGEAKDATITPAGTHSRVDFGLRAELGYEWTSRHLGAGIAAASDVAFERTRYDLALPAGTRRNVAEIPAFRPGVTLTLALH